MKSELIDSLVEFAKKAETYYLDELKKNTKLIEESYDKASAAKELCTLADIEQITADYKNLVNSIDHALMNARDFVCKYESK